MWSLAGNADFRTAIVALLSKSQSSEVNRNLTKKDIQMANKYMKRYSKSLVIREMQIKMMSYCYTPIRMAKIKSSDKTKCW